MLRRLWRWLFGPAERSPSRCRSTMWRGSAFQCDGISDPECRGYLCRGHCLELCGARCGPRPLKAGEPLRVVK